MCCSVQSEWMHSGYSLIDLTLTYSSSLFVVLFAYVLFFLGYNLNSFKENSTFSEDSESFVHVKTWANAFLTLCILNFN